MARYIMLGKFSLNGVKGVIKSSADRASEAKKAVEAAEGKFISYDLHVARMILLVLQTD